ncbi:MAG: hydrogenase maturation protein HypF [Solirubrobacteraceae bacterium]|nr:hydrogenase maturation protein HypF [Solirubrobacteraceae bacterium]
MTRVRARVDGTVQGVGFRPYVFRLAEELGLGGFVGNDERGVVLEVEGEAAAVERFLERLPREAPPLATIERVGAEPIDPLGGGGEFRIVASAREGPPDALVSPDSAVCEDCLAELFDPADRRYRYPFVNCTACGPRFTIVRGVPYDRPLTTMAGFTMCAACRAEYEDPRDRRFHAQPNACPDCGPAVALVDAGGALVAADDPVRAAAAALRAGRIVAVKGIGGFHLACRADDEAAVAALRARKHREDRPFALMASDVAAARALVALGPVEEALLAGRERPIVIAPRLPDAAVAPAVAPRCAELGVMLPYAPLQHVLLADCGGPLVMTSGNVADEPIVYRDADALARLASIADLFVVHDRPIHVRADDSVVRAVSRRAPVRLRRSRGFVPDSLALPLPADRPLLACGAELKSTFCVARGARAWVGHHIGDLRHEETLRAFEEGVAHFERLFAVAPEVVAHDLHPDYLSTAYALAREGVERVAVQHHHAHLAACLAEHGETGPAVGAIFDGSGLGTDGTVWGGELLVGGLDGFERAGHLHPVRLPGGDQAVRQPWRMACAWLVAAGERDDEAPPPIPPALADAVDDARWRAIASLARGGVAAPVTTSAGRLFDAVAALCGLRATVTYEGQAAVELEAACDPLERGSYPLPVGEGFVLDARETIRAVARDAAAGVATGVIAARFHRALADAVARACVEIAARHGTDVAVLSGGVLQNVRLLEGTSTRLEAAGLRVLVPERLPPNDGGISFGQAAVAAAIAR